MEEHIFYRIISKQPKHQNGHLKTTQEFHRSAPFRMYHQANQTSLTFLSSLIQTQNLIHNKINTDCFHFTTRELQPKRIEESVPKRAQSENPQTETNPPQRQLSNKNIKKLEQLNLPFKRKLKKDNALCNILGEVDAASAVKVQSKIMEDTIHKAKTYTAIPDRVDALSLSKRKKNRVQMKEDFTNFIRKKGWKNNLSSKIIEKGTKVPTTQYIKHNQNTQQSQKAQQKGDLYHFLNTQHPRNKRIKTDSASNYPTLSKRMVEMMLKKQLGIYSDNFNFVQVGNRKSFKLNTHQ